MPRRCLRVLVPLLAAPAPGCARRLRSPRPTPAGRRPLHSQGISREDLARVVAAAALEVEVPPGGAATVVVGAAGPGAPPEDWAAALQPALSA